MYVPPAFAEDRLPVLHDAIRAARLCTLVTLGSDGLEASHVPVLLDADAGPHGTLLGHFSKANPQWRRLSAEVPALAIFSGPDAYVTPSWYETKKQTGKAVPTWNYVAVHAYGALELFDDADSLRGVVTRLTERHEAGRPDAWAVSDAPEDFLQGMFKGIVGFRLPIARIEGKWKLSQNRPAEDRAGVVAGLRADGGPEELAVAALMEERG
ncbi:FMN-binding negative transcriptional regulator [Azospirillum sp. TSO22-1]|uniref:FMN-binding negative transcriptional regulator n=1 Tax=Azospirillum sp. TSO22-1 TaxID=716789 RepID=UPI000D616375|nr:FMN-binding negative transcriptional regulator [Azospirillum sp. TSO22-1]PWC55947.1 transcriptional regulator [Azospirillum sp. TSO22-1]